MNYTEMSKRLSAVRDNMKNKMVAGVDYEKEAAEVVRLSAELKTIDKNSPDKWITSKE